MKLSDEEIIHFVRPFTLVGEERIRSVLSWVERVTRENVPGDLVDVGVCKLCKGGVPMAMALKCMQLGDIRKIHVFVLPEDGHADEVARNLRKTFYPAECLRFQHGNVPEGELPNSVALLRLDTESTRFMLEHLEGRVSLEGLVMVEGDGNSEGCRAVHEWVDLQVQRGSLQQVDGTSTCVWRKRGVFGLSSLRPRVRAKDSVACIAEDVRLFSRRQDMLQVLGLSGTMAEIGVFRGDFAREILDASPAVERLFLVDAYGEEINCSGNQDGNNLVYYRNAELLPFVVERFRPDIESGRVTLYRMWSDAFWETLEDNTLDAVYIDGDHSYEGCLRDLEAARRKVKAGGWIMGHDFLLLLDKCQTEYEFGVNRAVNEFCAKYGLQVSIVAMDGCSSFALVNRKEETVAATPRIAVACLAVGDNEEKLQAYLQSMHKNLESHAEYCRIHGYAYEMRTGLRAETQSQLLGDRARPDEPLRPSSWLKLLFLQELAQKYDFVLWVDADARFQVMSRPLTLLTPMLWDTRHRMLIAVSDVETLHLQAGVFMIKGGQETVSLLQTVWDTSEREEMRENGWWEQLAINLLHRESAAFREQVAALPPFAMYLLQSHPRYKTPQCHEALIIHYAGLFRSLMD